MRILFLGDIVGKAGRQGVCSRLPGLIHRTRASFVVANCENASGGAGIRPEHARALLAAGVDVLTTGNHVWRHKEIVPYADSEPNFLRPANFPPGTPGHGHVRVERSGLGDIVIINLIGRVFMDSVDCPFQTVDRILAALDGGPPVILVDMHAEATSEKGAMARFLDGRVTAVVGTHTHVQTADESVLPGGTAFHTDAGMCGPTESVIGVKSELSVRRFRTHMPTRFEPAAGPTIVQGTIVTVDPATGRATGVERLQERVPTS